MLWLRVFGVWGSECSWLGFRVQDSRSLYGHYAGIAVAIRTLQGSGAPCAGIRVVGLGLGLCGIRVLEDVGGVRRVQRFKVIGFKDLIERLLPQKA